MSPSRTSHFVARCAFSLVEVLVAIGLMTFALLIIFSLLPVGLSAMHEASRQIVETEIFNSLGAELASTPFDELAAHRASRFPVYFDNEGNESTADKAIFTVQCTLAPPEMGDGELRRVTILIGYHRDPLSGGASPNTSKRTFLLVDRGI